MTHKKSKLFYGWYIVAGMAIILAVLGPASVAVANIYQVAVIKTFNIFPSSFALNNSIILGMGIFLPPIISNYLTDRLFKKFYITSVVIYAAAYASYGLVNTILPTSILITN
ncbi:hypothetical protein N1495_00425 [Streptococcus didelphis]|uniref:Major facilitator superfamily (MFS) profile domain-containing protein n=1 Tax=Streptococcus didelphis TaxID=102886 RepID=A0ABY9LGD8_9STRE|nr:hypothetical protein [Streptococcus didelphis]WMB27962.1 hypothetical protein N1496_08135 [Streptococcus didelphis]WMB29570.1 hypothetical protein N1495_00425 [Streptococcus didelphis]